MRAVIACGDRYADRERWWDVVERELYAAASNDGIVVIHGAASGIDSIAGDIATDRMGMNAVAVPARWKELGKAAGPRRNRAMLDILLALRDHGYTVLVLAFHDDIESSKGTKNMRDQAIQARVPVKVVTSA